jgi:signal transduction histidine kinase/DNA-binding response OmpR family regulator
MPFKLYLGLGIAVLLVLIVGYVSITSMQREEKEAKLVTHSNKVINLVRQIRHELSQLKSARRLYWATGNYHYMEPWEKVSTTIPTQLDQLAEMVSDDAVQTRNVQRLDAQISHVLTYWAHEGKVDLNAGKEAEVRLLVEEEKRLDDVYTQFELTKGEEQRILLMRENEVIQYNRQTRTILYVGVAILLLVVLLLVNSILQVLRSRYKAGKTLQSNLDEMAKLNQVAYDKNWTLEGFSYVNNRIQWVESTQVLADKIIHALVEYLEVPAGAIYFFKEEEQELEMVAAVSVGRASIKKFKLGEGIVGNAAMQKMPSLIKHIPPSYWRVVTGLGEITGNGQIMCVPLWVNGELKGLIELGCFDSFTPLQQTLLNNIGDMLGTAINSAQARDKIETLLQEVQEQQEELQQANDELSRQTEELLASEEELRAQENELKQVNIELNERNNLIEEARKNLSVKAKELEASSRYKSEFLANMSHELRTPLNSILILAKLMSDNKDGNLTNKQVEYATIIGKSGKDLLALINNILDLSKIEAGKIELEIEDVILEDVKSDLEQLFKVVASEKKVQLSIEMAKTAPKQIRSDKQKLEQVLKNLLSNAFKFTPAGGSISVAIGNKNQFQKDWLEISVSDTGIGISDDKQQLIFEAFQQADGSTSRKYGGTGLGLSISKELVRLLGGKIEVFSEEGKGSTFTLTLPRVFEMKNEEKVPEEVALLKAYEASEESQLEDDKANIGHDDKVMLIIEDDVNFATITRDFARAKGYKVIMALRGDIGFLYAKQFKPTAIILDIQLPVMDGWTLLKKFKANAELKDIPVHIISAFDDNRLKHAGVLAYLKKPVDMEGLEQAFGLISKHIDADEKKILIVSDNHFHEEELEHLFKEKDHQVSFEQVRSIQSAAEKIAVSKYDCVIVNVEQNIDIHAAQQMSEQLHNKELPLIIYLDEDISSEEELQLRKISDVIVRHSGTANSRLIDELELFLYKMHELDHKTTPAAHTSVAANVSLQQKKILVVDDDMRNVFALSAVLESNQMEVVIASDGKESLDQLKKHKDIDLVLMDIMMPEMDGYEAMKLIRNDLKLTLPIIAVTAKAMVGDREKCIAAGASDYIAKPLDMQKLLSLMRVWLTK